MFFRRVLLLKRKEVLGSCPVSVVRIIGLVSDRLAITVKVVYESYGFTLLNRRYENVEVLVRACISAGHFTFFVVGLNLEVVHGVVGSKPLSSETPSKDERSSKLWYTERDQGTPESR